MSLIATFTAALALSASPQATLAEATCDRMAEVLLAYQREADSWAQLAAARGEAPNPEVAAMTRRIVAVQRYAASRRLIPREATAADGILFRTTTFGVMAEFERRCRA